MLCFWTGLRAGEALQLRRKNIAYNDAKKAYIISLRGKGQKGGVVAYGIERREDVLDKYVHLRPQDYLFLTPDCVLEDEHGLRPRLATAYNRYLEAVREAGRLVGIHNLGTHDARRTFGTRIRLRKDLVAAKRALRHADIQTTMRYIGDDDETEAITAMLDFQKET
jgi:integrase